jgi:hypothetical protein
MVITMTSIANGLSVQQCKSVLVACTTIPPSSQRYQKHPGGYRAFANSYTTLGKEAREACHHN